MVDSEFSVDRISNEFEWWELVGTCAARVRKLASSACTASWTDIGWKLDWDSHSITCRIDIETLANHEIVPWCQLIGLPHTYLCDMPAVFNLWNSLCPTDCVCDAAQFNLEDFNANNREVCSWCKVQTTKLLESKPSDTKKISSNACLHTQRELMSGLLVTNSNVRIKIGHLFYS